MLAKDARPFDLPEADPRCVECDRSIVLRYGGRAPAECEACSREFELLKRAGKLRLGEGYLEVVKIGAPNTNFS